MNVTSLLNSAPEARQHWWPKECSSRNRTPWDAGGYSLPLHTHSNGIFPTLTPLNESPLENLNNEFGHKLSDSHSSLSSFASSNNASHSRPSSTSTLSSLYQHNQIITDPDSRPSKASSICSSPVSPSSGRYRHHPNLSLADCVNKLALVAEYNTHSNPCVGNMDQPGLNADIAKIRLSQQSVCSKQDELFTGEPRPISPSDAVFMGRSKSSVTSCSSGFPNMVVAKSFNNYETSSKPEPISQELGQHVGRHSIDIKFHKRASSAPGFQRSAEGTPRNECRPSISPTLAADMTPPSSRHQSADLTRDCVFVIAPNTPPNASTLLHDRKPCCMYITDCDTGSQLRKAVSHIFGRNKMCTRRIPTHVWVWYCRKHYQRARYRNAKEWARTLQYDLVTKQIDRLQQWSDENRRLGEGDIVRDYELAIRKREQKRIDAQKSKRDQGFSDSEEDASSDRQDDALSTTAVPEWLRDRSGRNYNAAMIHKIIDGIKEDLAGGKLSAWPDIEILPNIVKEEDRQKPPSKIIKTKSSSFTHKRSQSLSITQKIDITSPYQNVDRTRITPPNSHNFSGGLSHKRKRVEYGDEDDHRLTTLEGRRSRESGQVRITAYNSQKFTHEAANPHVFAPQRYDVPSSPSRIVFDVSSYAVVSPKSSNSTHQRSQSDMDTSPTQQSSSYISRDQRFRLPSIELNHPTAHRHSSSPSIHTQLARAESSRQRPPFHSRHQSTPLLSNPFRSCQVSNTAHQRCQSPPLIRLSPSHTTLRSVEKSPESDSPNGKRG